MFPAESSQTTAGPSASSQPAAASTESTPAGGTEIRTRSEQRLPAGSEIPKERTDTGPEDEDRESDDEVIDWAKEAEPIDDTQDVDEPAPGPKAKPAEEKPAAKFECHRLAGRKG